VKSDEKSAVIIEYIFCNVPYIFIRDEAATAEECVVVAAVASAGHQRPEPGPWQGEGTAETRKK
jgi:hypothetical protein